MARTGGVCTFLMIGLMVLGFLLSLVAQNQPVIGIIAFVMYLAAFVLWFVVMIAIKVNCDQNGYPRVGGLVWSILALTLAVIVVGIVAAIVVGTQMGRSGATPDPQTMLRAFGLWAVIIGLVALAIHFCFLFLGMRLNEFGAIASGAWKGAGIVLIIAACLGLLTLVLYIATALTQAWGILIAAGILGFIGLILWLVVWILVGIAFMGDAGRMAAAGPAAVQRR